MDWDGESSWRGTSSDSLLQLFLLTCFFLALLSIAIHNGLPQRTLTLCLAVKLKCLCSSSQGDSLTFPTIERKRWTHPLQRSALGRDVLKDWRPFLLSFLYDLLLSLLSFGFESLLLLSIWLYLRTRHLDRQVDYLGTLVGPLLSQPAFWKSHIPCLST